MLPGVLLRCELREHYERLWQEQAVVKTAQSALAFQGIMRTCRPFSKNAGGTALCSFSILEGLPYCTEYLEYVPLRVSPSCWTLGLGLFWIPGDTLIFFPQFRSNEIA